MADYKNMYLQLFRATEKAINILIEAQQTCEEMYLAEPELEFRVLGFEKRLKNKKGSP